MDVIEKEKRQPQLSRDPQEFRDNCGSKRRRVQERKGDCVEDTNSMMKRLEGDDWINNINDPLVYHPQDGWLYAYMHQGVNSF